MGGAPLRVETTGSVGQPTGREAGRLVLRAVGASAEPDESGFLARRARASVSALEPGAERRSLERILAAAAGAGREALIRSLVCHGGLLERRGRLAEAWSVYARARALGPGRASLTLHAARAARKRGEPARARALYRRAGREAAGRDGLGLLARIGEAMVSSTPERSLGRLAREALSAGETEAAAVALEARARARLGRGDGAGALRDLLAAAVRYGPGGDAARVAGEASELLTRRLGDGAGARELLLAALDAAPADAGVASRLVALCRSQGDELGVRRWAAAPAPCGGATRPELVALGPRRGATAAATRLSARIRAWRDRVGGGAAV